MKTKIYLQVLEKQSKGFTRLIKIIMLWMSILSFQNGFAQQRDSLFNIANHEYKQGNYSSAAMIYEDIIASGIHAPEIFYNLGNCYFRLQHFAEAILWYERALRGDPRNESIRYNLTLVNTLIKDDMPPYEELFFITWWKGLTSQLPTSSWIVLHILLFVVCLILTAIFLIVRKAKLKQLGFRGAVFFLVLSLVCLASGVQRDYDTRLKKEAIIMTETVTVKSGPGTGSTSLGDFHAGTKLRILSENDGWFEIKTSDGHIGWLPGKDLELI